MKTLKKIISEIIKLDIDIGDEILTGKFLNKKVKVKSISTDEYGSPTVNKKSILKIRIPKLYKLKEYILPQQIRIAKWAQLRTGQWKQIADVDYLGERNPTKHFALYLVNKGESEGNWVSPEKIKRVIGKNPYKDKSWTRPTDLGVASWSNTMKSLNEIIKEIKDGLAKQKRISKYYTKLRKADLEEGHPWGGDRGYEFARREIERGEDEDSVIVSLENKYGLSHFKASAIVDKIKDDIEYSKKYKLKLKEKEKNKIGGTVLPLREIYAGIDEPPKISEENDVAIVNKIDKLKDEIQKFQRIPSKNNIKIKELQDKIKKLEKKLYGKFDFRNMTEMKSFKKIIKEMYIKK